MVPESTEAIAGAVSALEGRGAGIVGAAKAVAAEELRLKPGFEARGTLALAALAPGWFLGGAVAQSGKDMVEVAGDPTMPTAEVSRRATNAFLTIADVAATLEMAGPAASPKLSLNLLDDFRDIAVHISPDDVRLNAPFEGSLGTTVSADVTFLYRAVGDAELGVINATGRIPPSLSGLEVKYFSATAEGASSYARQAVRGFGDPPYTLVETQIASNRLPEGVLLQVDQNVPAVVVPNTHLPKLDPAKVWSSMPVPTY